MLKICYNLHHFEITPCFSQGGHRPQAQARKPRTERTTATEREE